ncbi:hypothetical protein EYF80_008647 [Liparis tanakae]|uniref:Uncharacterized protein n=1 Tax=Liparis tanakae TaxID=230148 RepID=A0A4Z2IT38_9TELE|nr:hypothetical protein EYF80_008647 [Liparis tanakae]
MKLHAGANMRANSLSRCWHLGHLSGQKEVQYIISSPGTVHVRDKLRRLRESTASLWTPDSRSSAFAQGYVKEHETT